MTLRIAPDRLSKRTAIGLITTVLALGVAVPALVPGVAQAAPLETQPARPSLVSSFVRPDLISGDLLFKSFKVGEQASVPIYFKNDGYYEAADAEVRIGVGPDLANPRLNLGRARWLCVGSFPPVAQANLGRYVTCLAAGKLEPGAVRSLSVEATVTGTQGAWVTTLSDPKHKIVEMYEDNNSSFHNIAR
jgi:hypothetical protein